MTETEMKKALLELGSTPGEVAESLAKLGAAGYARDSRACVLACWGYAITGAPFVSVGCDITWDYEKGGSLLSVELPPAVYGLRCDFDHGKYGELLGMPDQFQERVARVRAALAAEEK